MSKKKTKKFSTYLIYKQIRTPIGISKEYKNITGAPPLTVRLYWALLYQYCAGRLQYVRCFSYTHLDLGSVRSSNF